MKRFLLSMTAVVFLGLYSPTHVTGQLWQAGAPGEDIGSIRLQGGMLQPLTDYSDGSSLESGPLIGVSGAYWPARYFGFTADIFRSENKVAIGGGFSALDGQDPVVWLYSLQAAIRYPFVGGNLAITPYIAGGPTAKSYKWAIYSPQMGGLFDRPYGGQRNTSFGWNYGAGLEVRLGPSGTFGFVTDVRSVRSDFDWFGLRTSQSDMMFTAGLSIHR